jgi:hypothetical protein
MKLKTLKDVLSEMAKVHKVVGGLKAIKYKVYVWFDTQDCDKPIVGIIDMNFNRSISDDRIIHIFNAIDLATPITMFDLGTVQYHVTKTEAFMKKPCGCC